MQLGRINLSNRVCISPGSYPSEVSFAHAGAIFSKTITLDKNCGNSGELLRNIDCGMINRVGLVNDGVSKFTKSEFHRLKNINKNVFVSVAGDDIQELVDTCAVVLLECGADLSGIELNLSCPNKKYLHNLDNNYVYDAVSEIKKVLKNIHDVPLSVKLPPWPDHIAMMGVAAEDAGADAVTAVNTIKALHFDQGDRPILGGLSGDALKPIALRCVYELRQKIEIPIFGVGGVSSVKDVYDFIQAGANAVQLCTVEMNKPGTLIEILRDLK